MRDKTFTERTEILERYLADIAGDRRSGLPGGLTQGDAVDLLNLISGLRDDLDTAREANEAFRHGINQILHEDLDRSFRSSCARSKLKKAQREFS